MNDPNLQQGSEEEAAFFEGVNAKVTALGERTSSTINDLYSFCGNGPVLTEFVENMQQRTEAKYKVISDLLQEIQNEMERGRNLQTRLEVLQTSTKDLVNSIFKMEP